MKSIRNLSKINFALKGRKYVTPDDLSPNEMKYLLLTALDLKASRKNDLSKQSFVGKNITFLLDSPCIAMQACVHNTSSLFKMPVSILISSEWETKPFPQDTGKLLSTTSDIIFCKAHRQSKLEGFAKGATVPVINVSSCHFVLLQILSNLLTLQQHFHNLDGLVIAWIGPPCPLLNTYLTIAPTLGMRVKFLCYSGGPVSPSHLYKVLSKGDQFVHRVKESKALAEVIEGAHAIATTDHSESNLKLKLSDVEKYADRNWVLFHTLPRTSKEIEDEIFDSERNLLWTSFSNQKWICAAIISKFLGFDENDTI
ncbi:hypothetical protein NQ315_009496 [Exocentrus adspersus]|uniref:ornithine carbamoyltransferase n=1 Tax=Exocentrus adspersus TaxID=1586481 RepID=A0AAV8WGT2_9CUCU|nr:hypothetical protein NQ315_009496 [Exocentrus adspersus]